MNQVLETERLLLRRFTLDDVAAFYKLGANPEIVRYVGNSPFESVSAAESALVAAPLRDYQVHGYGRLACVLKTTGEVIGFSGVKFLDELGETELGYRFLPEYWGWGFATEAGAASIEYARSVLKLRRLIGVVHPENVSSASVLRKLGFSQQGHSSLAFFGDLKAELYAKQI